MRSVGVEVTPDRSRKFGLRHTGGTREVCASADVWRFRPVPALCISDAASSILLRSPPSDVAWLFASMQAYARGIGRKGESSQTLSLLLATAANIGQWAQQPARGCEPGNQNDSAWAQGSDRQRFGSIRARPRADVGGSASEPMTRFGGVAVGDRIGWWTFGYPSASEIGLTVAVRF
jgi:hypothetical protein